MRNILFLHKMDTDIPPNIRLINPISKRFRTNQRFTSNEPPNWVEQSQDIMLNCLFSHHHIFGHFLVFQSSFKLHFSLPTFIPRYLRFTCCAGYLFVTDTVSTPTSNSLKAGLLLLVIISTPFELPYMSFSVIT